MTSAFDDFNFDNLMSANGGKNPFEDNSKSFARDERFYVLGKDENGSGSALIAFLPDMHKHLIQRVYKINSTITKNGKRRFCAEYSPSTIGLPDPFQEEWARRYNAGDRDGARQFGRTVRFITNIKVIKDPANPENEGKVFLYDMSQSMSAKIQKALTPSEADIQLGEERMEVYNPLAGYIFTLKCTKGSNGIPSYDASAFKQLGANKTIYGTYTNDAELEELKNKAVDDIRNKTYDLGEFLKPEAYLSYDELKEKFNYVTFANVDEKPASVKVESASPDVEINAASTASTATSDPEMPNFDDLGSANPAPSANTATTTETKKTDSLDDLLSGIL